MKTGYKGVGVVYGRKGFRRVSEVADDDRPRKGSLHSTNGISKRRGRK
jgi:hypothetical protein